MVRIQNCPDVEIFDGSQGHGNTAYEARVEENPKGFVAQAYKPSGADVTRFHRANCEEIRSADKHNDTQGMFFMAFSHSLEALKTCVEGWPGKVEYCSRCTPHL